MVTVSTAAWAGTARTPGTTMSSVALIASHRTPSGTGAEPSRRKSGEPSRSARTIAPNGTRCAHGEPPNGAPRVTIVSTFPASRPPAMACAMTTPPRLWPIKCTLSAPVCDNDSLNLDDEPVGYLLHGSSERRVGERVDCQAFGGECFGATKDQLDFVPPEAVARAAPGASRVAGRAGTGRSAPNAGSVPPPTRCSDAGIVTTDAISPSSYACTIAARPIVRTSVRALAERSRRRHSRLAVSARRRWVPTGAFPPSALCDMSQPLCNATRSASRIAVGGRGVIEGSRNLCFPPARFAPAC